MLVNNNYFNTTMFCAMASFGVFPFSAPDPDASDAQIPVNDLPRWDKYLTDTSSVLLLTGEIPACVRVCLCVFAGVCGNQV